MNRVRLACTMAWVGLTGMLVSTGCGDAGSGGDDSGDDDSGDQDNPTMDCAWLEGSNCWKDSLAEAQLCLPPETEVGVYDGTHSTCTYQDGTVVRFDVEGWDVLVEKGSETCIAFVELDPGYQMETELGLLELEATEPSEPVTCHCPDGSSYTAQDYDALLSCDLDTLPSVTTSSNYLELNGGPGNAPVRIYTCEEP